MWDYSVSVCFIESRMNFQSHLLKPTWIWKSSGKLHLMWSKLFHSQTQISVTSVSLNWPQSTYRSVPWASLCYSVCHYARIFQDKSRSNYGTKEMHLPLWRARVNGRAFTRSKALQCCVEVFPIDTCSPHSNRSENNKTCLHVNTASCFPLPSS